MDAWRRRDRILARTGVVPETPTVPPRMTTAQACAFCAALRRGWDQASVDRRLERFSVDPGLEFGSLSRGQQTQVSLALALGGGPEFLVLDDPTLGLDPVARRDLFAEVLEDLAERGTTVLVTTHDLAGIEGIADHVAILHEGRMLLDEPLEGLKARFRVLRCPPDFPEEALAPMRPLRASRSALGLEAAVSAYSPEALAGAGLEPGNAGAAGLEDIFLATVATGGRS
jgi:ABC-2 type transport system ATP-binding protein